MLSVLYVIHRKISEVRFTSNMNIVLKVLLSVDQNLEVLLDIVVWCASLMGHGYNVIMNSCKCNLKFNLVAALPTESENNAPCVGSGVVSDDRRKRQSLK